MNAHYNLAVNLPLRQAPAEHLAAALAAFPVGPELLAYPSMEGGLGIREAIAGWMRRRCGHIVVDPRRLVVTLGARHALSLALDEACFAGETLLVESSTYHGLRASAEARGIRVAGVGMDGDGMLPAELERLAATTGARCVYLQPTLQNPTTATMPLARRREIAAVATRCDLTIIEGDVYSPLAWHGRDQLPPLAELVPDRCLHAGGIGKVLGPGLRVGWLLLPDEASHQRAASTIRFATDGLPALLPAIVAGWMADGVADALLTQLADRMVERNRLARAILGDDLVAANGLHVWLPGNDAADLEARALARGVHVAPVKPLAADGEHAAGVRLCLGAEEDLDRLETALRIVAGVR
ncbi:MAG TPA: PLP-dependent aminotransferase family protein [Luteibacter sp.]|uniref:aminotransferase-like domain-containing protein n=1 Tax=Luteibacter sp. TaxID=1886636 RepID=UPI002B6ECB2E|nr:PLP-dependent aminotransferase family protein [Luteibacter sp.]HVI54330.1 PLP-dependent aminotransferase family protein [Luteibacter sp.]